MLDDARIDLGREHGFRLLDEWLENSRAWSRRSPRVTDAIAVLKSLPQDADLREHLPAVYELLSETGAKALLRGLLVRGSDFQASLFMEPDEGYSMCGLPLGPLVTVSAYTSDAAGEHFDNRIFGGKAHSAGCRYHPRLHEDDDRFPLAECIAMVRASWLETLSNRTHRMCSYCGGYSFARLTADQSRYYESARRIHEISCSIGWQESRLQPPAGPPRSRGEADSASSKIRSLADELSEIAADPLMQPLLGDLQDRCAALLARL